MRHIISSLMFLAAACGNQAVSDSVGDRIISEPGQGAVEGSDSQSTGFNLQSAACTRGACPWPTKSEPVIFNRAFVDNHPTIYRDRPVWILANEFGVDAAGKSIDGGYCSFKGTSAVFENWSFGYRSYARYQGGWSYVFASSGSIDRSYSCVREIPYSTAFNEYGAYPAFTGIYTLNFSELDPISGSKTNTIKSFIVADRYTAPVSGLSVQQLPTRSPEGMQRLRLSWQMPSLPAAGRMVGYYVLVDGAPLRPTWRLVDDRGVLRNIYNRPLGNVNTNGGFQFFREAGATTATTVDLEVSPGIHRITLAYQWESPYANAAAHDKDAVLYTDSSAYCGILSPPECLGSVRSAGIMTSPGASVSVTIEDDVSFDRDFYAQTLWWLPKDQLYRHYLEHGIKEGRVPSPLLQAHLLPERLRSLPLAQALRLRYVDFLSLAARGDVGNLAAEDLVVLDPLEFAVNAQGAVCNSSVAYGRCLVRQYLNYAGDESGVGSSVFNVEVYLGKNPDVAAAANTSSSRRKFAIYHFINYGMRERRIASATFNESGYLVANPDVAAAVAQGGFGGYGGRHYLKYGKREGRSNGYRQAGTVVRTVDASGNSHLWLWNKPNQYCHIGSFGFVVGSSYANPAVKVSLWDLYLSTRIALANASTPMLTFIGGCKESL